MECKKDIEMSDLESKNKIVISTEYNIRFDNVLVLPEGVEESDIEDVSVKWGHADVSLKDGRKISVQLDEDFQSYAESAKRPDEYRAVSVEKYTEEQGYDDTEFLSTIYSEDGEIVNPAQPK